MKYNKLATPELVEHRKKLFVKIVDHIPHDIRKAMKDDIENLIPNLFTGGKKRITTAMVQDEVSEFLDEFSKLTGISKSEIIRLGLAIFIKALYDEIVQSLEEKEND